MALQESHYVFGPLPRTLCSGAVTVPAFSLALIPFQRFPRIPSWQDLSQSLWNGCSPTTTPLLSPCLVLLTRWTYGTRKPNIIRPYHKFWHIHSSANKDSVLLRYTTLPLDNWFTFIVTEFQSSGSLKIQHNAPLQHCNRIPGDVLSHPRTRELPGLITLY